VVFLPSGFVHDEKCDDVLVSNAAADDVHPATIGFRQALQRPFGISRKQPHLMF